ncbi:hypothetical protein C8F04DRAFT_1390750 [Mycena alexandri]|uniref:F-box domain-containing protein n=1 Tax=Mycena alexandri TaxID=1745969 RepID=A0AAD6TDI0_9AGAR|nr:hypothetical protein C8F04DRAFT_1390750 [Mycena alexandri]
MAPHGKAVKRRRRTTMSLPPEICAKICEDVNRKDLVTLCRTSRLFGDQAQRIIYRAVDLRRSTSGALLSWCLAVTRHPQLAQRVHSLSLRLPGDLSFSSDAGKIARALAKCLNLKELSIHRDNSDPFGSRHESQQDSIQGWIITKCPFRLTKFSCSYFKISFLSQFWTPQSEVRVLSLPHCTEHFPVFDDQLPHLIALEVGNARALPADRPLQRIQLRGGRYLPELSVLGAYSASLTTLNILQAAAKQDVSTLQIFDTVAQWVPGLLHLALIEIDEHTQKEDLFSEGCPISALAKFTQLRTLTMYCQRITAFDDPAFEHIYQLNDPVCLQAFGQAILTACPTLQRAIIAARTDTLTGHQWWYPGTGLRRELVCTLTRTAGGETEVEFGTQFDFHAVSMFWNA